MTDAEVSTKRNFEDYLLTFPACLLRPLHRRGNFAGGSFTGPRKAVVVFLVQDARDGAMARREVELKDVVVQRDPLQSPVAMIRRDRQVEGVLDDLGVDIHGPGGIVHHKGERPGTRQVGLGVDGQRHGEQEQQNKALFHDQVLFG